mmetsp:Transcript_23535/g.54367  ORF Transcript_23535/g.54367 Transcript_23535/m.54367 type:complete len:122 (-) Transcript_23535:194-559(-)
MGCLPDKHAVKDTANTCTLIVENGELRLRKDSPFSKDVAPAGSRLSNEQWQQLQQVLLNEFTQVSPFNQPPFYSDPHKDKAQRVVSQLEQQFGCVFKYDCFWDNYHFPTKCWCHLVTMQWQ